jgi:hypothetical protein
LAIVDYEYARRRYEWSKRFNLIAAVVCLALGVVALAWGALAFLDWQWLSQHFSGGGSSRWTPDKINLKLTYALVGILTGVLGIVTFLFAFMFVRKALDDDNQDQIKRYSMLAGLTGLLPGALFGGLLEIFIWRAHSADSFTIFGLLGSPEPEPAPPTETVVAAEAAANEAKRKAEFMALFNEKPSAPAPDYRYAPEADPYAPASYGGSASAEASGEYASAGGAAAAPAAVPAEASGQYYEAPSGAPICTCGRPMEWVAEYNRYYCYTDDKYEGET